MAEPSAAARSTSTKQKRPGVILAAHHTDKNTARGYFELSLEFKLLMQVLLPGLVLLPLQKRPLPKLLNGTQVRVNWPIFVRFERLPFLLLFWSSVFSGWSFSKVHCHDFFLAALHGSSQGFELFAGFGFGGEKAGLIYSPGSLHVGQFPM